jgi:hypothetical protein
MGSNAFGFSSGLAVKVGKLEPGPQRMRAWSPGDAIDTACGIFAEQLVLICGRNVGGEPLGGVSIPLSPVEFFSAEVINGNFLQSYSCLLVLRFEKVHYQKAQLFGYSRTVSLCTLELLTHSLMLFRWALQPHSQ